MNGGLSAFQFPKPGELGTKLNPPWNRCHTYCSCERHNVQTPSSYLSWLKVWLRKKIRWCWRAPMHAGKISSNGAGSVVILYSINQDLWSYVFFFILYQTATDDDKSTPTFKKQNKQTDWVLPDIDLSSASLRRWQPSLSCCLLSTRVCTLTSQVQWTPEPAGKLFVEDLLRGFLQFSPSEGDTQ